MAIHLSLDLSVRRHLVRRPLSLARDDLKLPLLPETDGELLSLLEGVLEGTYKS